MGRFLRRKWKLICLVTLGGGLTLYVGLGLLIGHHVRSAVSAAQAVAPGDPVTALLWIVNSPEQSIAKKNKAIWALGQLGDPRALETLVPLVSEAPCDHSHLICQHELEKAIEGCRGGVNAGAVFWRYGELAPSKGES